MTTSRILPFAVFAPILMAVPLAAGQTIEDRAYAVEPTADGGLEATNPGQGMRATFAAAAVSVAVEDAEMGLALEAFGREGALAAVSPAQRVAEGRRVEYRRGPLTEWYVNDERGLEQGFTIAAPPPGDASLQLVLSIRGNLALEVLPGGRDARFVDDCLDTVLHYAGLCAWDADGRELAASLAAKGGRLTIEVDDEAATYPLTVDPWIATEVAHLWAGDGDVGDFFGSAVSIDGDTAVVGAEWDDLEVGVGNKAGSAYVFERDLGGPGAWGEVAKLRASDAAGHDEFGNSVSLSGDTLVVGAPLDDTGAQLDAGSVYLFERDQGGPGAWGEVGKITASDMTGGDKFGFAVALSGDTLVVGAFAGRNSGADAGSVYVLERELGGPGAWGEVIKLAASDAENGNGFGFSVAITGDTVIVGAPSDDHTGGVDCGSAYVFGRHHGGRGTWGEVGKLVAGTPRPGAFFGWSVAAQGDTAVIGAIYDDHSSLIGPGSAYVFERDLGGADAWGQAAFLAANDAEAGDHFGTSVAIFGDLAVIGAPEADGSVSNGTGVGYAFERNRGGAGAWGQSSKLSAADGLSGDEFGFSITSQGTTVLVGARRDDAGHSIGDIGGLAVDPATGTLFGTDIDSDELITIDPATGVGTPVGFLVGDGVFHTNVQGLAFDSLTSTLYGADIYTGELITIDPGTAVTFAVGALGFQNVRGLAFDSNTGTLWGCDDDTDQLISIDTTTGAGTAVGPLGFPRVWGLAFGSVTDTLYGTEGGTQGAMELLTIDTTTGAGTSVGVVGADGVRALATEPGTGLLHGADRDADELMSIDPTSGLGTPVGPFSSLVVNTGSAYVYEMTFTSENYCTAGASTSGCTASISDSGTASATAASGFELHAIDVEGGKDGLYFYGTNGRQANPWGNGTSFQCVVPPVTRAALLDGTGTVGACDGSFSEDLNALWTAKPNKNPGVGALVAAQLWYRDPFNTSNQTTGLSNAIQFQVGP